MLHNIDNFIWNRDAEPLLKHHTEHMLSISIAYLFGLLLYQQNFKPDSKKTGHPFFKYMERVWNLSFSVFSGVCFWGLISNPADFSVSLDVLFNQKLKFGYWIFLYCFTKVLEYVDTVFLMLNNKQIHTLHWSHHVITAVFTWYAALYKVNVVHAVFAFTNLFVHTIMYFYYFLTSFESVKARVQKYAYIVTLIQILQFVICLSVIVWNSFRTNFTLLNSAIPLVMYSYYLHMFVSFYIRRYQKKKVDCVVVETSERWRVTKLS